MYLFISLILLSCVNSPLLASTIACQMLHLLSVAATLQVPSPRSPNPNGNPIPLAYFALVFGRQWQKEVAKIQHKSQALNVNSMNCSCMQGPFPAPSCQGKSSASGAGIALFAEFPRVHFDDKEHTHVEEVWGSGKAGFPLRFLSNLSCMERQICRKEKNVLKAAASPAWRKS